MSSLQNKYLLLLINLRGSMVLHAAYKKSRLQAQFQHEFTPFIALFPWTALLNKYAVTNLTVFLVVNGLITLFFA